MSMVRANGDLRALARASAAHQGMVIPASHHLLLATIAVIVAAFIVWAYFAPLDEVTRGMGRAIPSSDIKVMQTLEGGVVEDIFVKAGDIVEPGQVLIRLRDTFAAADFKSNRARYFGYKAAIARLTAEIDGHEPRFGKEIMAEAPEAAASERAAYDARRKQYKSQSAILKEQTSQRRQEVVELKSKIVNLKKSLKLTREELAIMAPLVKRGSAARLELLRLQRGATEQESELEAQRLSLPRKLASVAEAQRRIQEHNNTFRAEALKEMTTLKVDLSAISESITAQSDRVRLTEARSPVRGTVKEVKVNTIGGVVGAGQDLIEIVPLDDQLLIEAQIRPSDIAFLHPGQKATVKITAYDYSIYGGLEAKLIDISADTIIDDDGESFYRVRLSTNKNYVEKSGQKLPIIPGMTAIVDVLTGQKTVLDYLLKPFFKARDNALRER